MMQYITWMETHCLFFIKQLNLNRNRQMEDRGK